MAQMHDRSSATREAETERGRVLQGLRAEHEAARVAARDGLEQVRAIGWAALSIGYVNLDTRKVQLVLTPPSSHFLGWISVSVAQNLPQRSAATLERGSRRYCSMGQNGGRPLSTRDGFGLYLSHFFSCHPSHAPLLTSFPTAAFQTNHAHLM